MQVAAPVPLGADQASGVEGSDDSGLVLTACVFGLYFQLCVCLCDTQTILEKLRGPQMLVLRPSLRHQDWI